MNSHNDTAEMNRGIGACLDQYIESFRRPSESAELHSGHDQDLADQYSLFLDWAPLAPIRLYSLRDS
jgi:hypothetical protein